VIVVRLVHWGDCSPSGAVFYPHYYRWFDEATWEFFAAEGMAIGALAERYGNVGLPLMNCRAEFRRPCRLGDQLSIDIAVAAVTADTITLSHHILNGGKLAVRGEEVRFWGVRAGDGSGRLVRGPLPDDVRLRLAGLVRPDEEGRQWLAPH
jgi:YbgC/YbaW family acyl-CoA thioester hydrolase